MTSHGLCPVCLDKALRCWLGRKVRAENSEQSASGVLSGYHVNGRNLKVVIQEGKHLYVIENARKLSFQDQRQEEVKLLD